MEKDFMLLDSDERLAENDLEGTCRRKEKTSDKG